MWVLLGLGARHAGGLAQPAQPGRRQRELSALIAQERKGRLPGVRTLFFHLSQTVRMLGVHVCFGDICEIGLPSWYQVKNPPTKAGDVGSIPGSGRCPGGGNGNPLQCSCLENPQGQRSLVGYGPWGRKRVGHDSATEDTSKTELACCVHF